MSAQILKRAASPVPLSCILHIIAILFLAMLGAVILALSHRK